MEMWQLKQRQALPLEVKIELTKKKIREWYEAWDGEVYVSYSGGKDSTVLLHMVRSIYPDIPAIFIDTGLEYPEIKEQVRATENVVVLRPKMQFSEVIEKYGFPVVSKEQSRYIHQVRTTNSDYLRELRLHGGSNGKSFKVSEKWKYLIDAPFKISDNCCEVMKKRPVKKYEKDTMRKPMTGEMAGESLLRKQRYLQHGCNGFNTSRPKSTPIGFWLEEDVWAYIRKFNVPYSSIYDTGVDRTGCMFCMYGIQFDGSPNRFHRMKETHPKHYDYCINKLGCGAVLDYIGIEYGKEKV